MADSQSPHAREAKPLWSAVPVNVRTETERLLGARVTRAVRAFGGYGWITDTATIVSRFDALGG